MKLALRGGGFVSFYNLFIAWAQTQRPVVIVQLLEVLETWRPILDCSTIWREGDISCPWWLILYLEYCFKKITRFLCCMLYLWYTTIHITMDKLLMALSTFNPFSCQWFPQSLLFNLIVNSHVLFILYAWTYHLAQQWCRVKTACSVVFLRCLIYSQVVWCRYDGGARMIWKAVITCHQFSFCGVSKSVMLTFCLDTVKWVLLSSYCLCRDYIISMYWPKNLSKLLCFFSFIGAICSLSMS